MMLIFSGGGKRVYNTPPLYSSRRRALNLLDFSRTRRAIRILITPESGGAYLFKEGGRVVVIVDVIAARIR
jgi:hypothetical protein